MEKNIYTNVVLEKKNQNILQKIFHRDFSEMSTFEFKMFNQDCFSEFYIWIQEISFLCFCETSDSATSELNFSIKYTSFIGQKVFQTVYCNDGMMFVSLITFYIMKLYSPENN